MLTPRRIEIFKAIVDEYIRTAEPVGSKTLQKKWAISRRHIHLPAGFRAHRVTDSTVKTC